MARLYDHVLACGDIAVDRYVQYGIFSRDDITRNRVIRMGDTVISPFDPGLFASDNSINTSCLIYIPTWEGGFEEENFSSTAHPQTADTLALLCRQLKVNNILVKPHPNLGARQAQAAHGLKQLIENLYAQGINVAYTDSGNNNPLATALTSCTVARRYTHGTWHPVRGVVDVSAAEAMLAAQRIPSFVLAKPDKEIYAPDLYWQLRQHAVIRLGDNTWKNTLASYVGSDLEIQDQKLFFDALLSYTTPALATMSQAERMNWLVKTTALTHN